MASHFLNSEYLSLKTVLLCRPFFKTKDAYDPKKALHLRKVDPVAMDRELEEIIRLYGKFGIKSHLIDAQKISPGGSHYLFNLMFTRDLFFMTPKGAIVSRMASLVRREETKYLKKALKKQGVPIRKVVRGKGTFEGADALWVNPKIVVVGVGNRTNDNGFKQVKEELNKDGVRCLRFPASCGSLHLLGAAQFIDKNLAMVRVKLVRPEFVDFLQKNKIEIIRIPENDEVKNKQAFNFITIAPRKIIMPANCPKTKKIFQQQKIKVLAEVPVTQLINAGGGLACATGVLKRAD